MKTFESKEEELQSKLDAVKAIVEKWEGENCTLFKIFISSLKGVINE